MKKMICISVVLLLMLAGCQSSKNELPIHTDDKAAMDNGGQIQATEGSLNVFEDEEFEIEPAPVFYESLDMFLGAWAGAHTGSDSLEDRVLLMNRFETDNAAKRIKVPVLLSEDYVLRSIEANEYYYEYSYGPVDSTEPGGAGRDTTFEVFVSKKIGFETAIAQRGLEAVNGMAYDSEDNVWLIDNSGKVIDISSPDGIILENAEQLAEYFTFETYGISADNQLMKVEDVTQ